MSFETSYQDHWGSRMTLLAAMLSQTLGASTVILLPQQAVTFGAAGHMILYAAVYIFIGIPVMYMEYITGQFTGRDCIQVWNARTCLSHVAYVQIFWQITCVIFNQSFCSFVVHYFLISFEKPIPYYVCGPWSNPDCNIQQRNYTIHQDCLNAKSRLPYCVQLCKTFPEYQYWRFNILGLANDNNSFHLAWRVTLASGLISIAIFFTCFRRLNSVKHVLAGITMYIFGARLLFMVGSMLQKGIVVKFEDAIDSDFALFLKYVQLPSCVTEVLFSLNLGTGISFNMASRSSFRSPCYSNTVIVVVISAAVTIFGICTNALMLCPYAFKFGIHPFAPTEYPMFITYEMLPRLVSVYESKGFWLIVGYSVIASSFFCVNIVILSSAFELAAKRYGSVVQYPGIVTLAVVLCLFFGTIPLLGNKSLLFMVDLQRGLNFLTVFVVVIECFTFLLWYGLRRFSEDVHFMLGMQPRAYMKTFWLVSFFVLVYAFSVELHEIYSKRESSLGHLAGWWLLISIITLTIVVALGKVAWAAYNKQFRTVMTLDPSWGPRSELLRRSRAMFTTHAMTKEYIYRQYHLQAGILMRQRRCNIRNW